MAEENQQQPEQAVPSCQLVRVYLKDASLEMPNAPEIFMAQPSEDPNVNVQFEVGHRPLPVEGAYEVIVRGTITVPLQEKTMFLVEGKQAGIFEIKNIPEEGVKHIANVTCPTILYPYLRANLADLINRTGLPTIHMPEVNFEAMYQQRMAQQAQAAQEEVAHA